MTGPTTIAIELVLVLLNLGVILGGSMMLMARMRWLAITGSILAMLPNCCCLLGLPFGIWSLIVLMRQDVANAFT